MRKWLIGIGIAVAAAALGVGAAFGATELLKGGVRQTLLFVRIKTDDTKSVENPQLPENVPMPFGMGRGSGILPGRGAQDDQDQMPGRMTPWNGRSLQDGQTQSPHQTSPQEIHGAATAITLEEARQQAAAFAAKVGSNIEVAEVLEFERNFYAVLVEKDTGRGAMEIMANRYGRGISLEAGVDMLWNLKYGPAMRRKTADSTDNTLTLEEARQAAGEYLGTKLSGATLQEDGYSFYGYYSFKYSVDGKTAGILSVNGLTGEVRLHNGQGAFLSEQETEQ
jgi:hypothetical protein